MSNNYDYLFKYILLGDAGCGKSCLLERIVNDKYDESYTSTIGVDFGIKIIDIGSVKIKLHIWDTAGQEQFRSVIQNYYRNAIGIIVVFDVTDMESFRHVERWINEYRINSNNVYSEIVLVGNKVDLENVRCVSSEEAIQLAKRHQILYIETSAKTSQNVNETFRIITETIYQKLALIKILPSDEYRFGIQRNNQNTSRLNLRDKTNKKNKKCCQI